MNKEDSTPRKKLVLHKETVRHLTGAELTGVVGGRMNMSRVTQCECPTFMCGDPAPASRVNASCLDPNENVPVYLP